MNSFIDNVLSLIAIFLIINALSVILFGSNKACAGENYLVVHATAYHPHRRDLNELNMGLAYRQYEGDYFLSAGGYKNSINRLSLYAGLGKDIVAYKNIRSVITLGLLSGYNTPLPIIPFVMPELVAEFEDIKLIFNYSPKVGKISSAAIALSVGFKF